MVKKELTEIFQGEEEVQPEVPSLDVPSLEAPQSIDQYKRKIKILDYIGRSNICDMLKDKQLEEIGMNVVEDWEDDKTSRSPREESLKKTVQLAMQKQETKNYPWPGASNVKFPLLTMASLQFASRAYPALIQDGKVVKGKVIGRDKVEVPVMDPQTGQPTGEMREQELGKQQKADRTSEFMNDQLMNQMEGWEENMDRLCHVLPFVGCLFKKTLYDPVDKKPQSNYIYPTDLYVQYYANSLKDAPRITHVFEFTKNEILERERMGLFNEQDDIGDGDGGINSIRLAFAGEQNQGDYTEDGGDAFLILEQHTWLDLDDDDYEEPYIVTVLHKTGKVLRIVPRYDRSDIYYSKKGEIVRIEPQQYFTKYGFIPSPDGSIYDMGFGELLYPINHAINTTLNQLMDAGTLANTGGGFIGGNLRLKGGNWKFRPAEYKVVDNFGGTIRDNIYELQHKEPSQTLYALMEFLVNSGREIASIKDVLTGEIPVNAPATTTIAAIEQGMSVFKAIYKRMHRSLKEEMKKIFKINQKYLTEDQYLNVTDDPNATMDDWNTKSFDIVPVSDPAAVTSMEKMARLQSLYDFLQDPMIDGIELRERIFKGLGVENIDDLIIPPMEAPPDPMAEANMQIVQLQGQLIQAQIQDIAARNELAQIKEQREGFKTMGQLQNDETKAEADTTAKVASSIESMAKAGVRVTGSEEYVQQLGRAKNMLVGREDEQEQQEIGEQYEQQQIRQEQEAVNPYGGPEGNVGGVGVPGVETPPNDETIPPILEGQT